MALDVKLTIAKTDLRYQEDAVCLIKLLNSGKDPVRVLNPATNLTGIALKVLDVKAGVEKTYQQPRKPGSMPPEEDPLAPGRSFEAGLPLLYLPKALVPGEYDVSVSCRYNGEKERAESAPLRVKIRPTTPRNLAIQGVENSVLYGFWVNLGEDPPEIARIKLDVRRGGGARDFRPVAKASLHAVPAFSVPPNKEVCPHHWAAWIDGAEIKVVHLHDSQGPSAVRSVPLPGGEARIVSPLHSDPTPDDDGRPNGALLLWMGERDRQESQLQAIRLTPQGATAQARAALPAPKPVWLSSFVRSDAKRMALFAQTAGGKVSLSEIPWPGGVGAPKKLGEWKGEFAAAGFSLDGDDVLHGALLLRTGVEAHSTLERVDFQIDAKGGFAAKPAERVDADPKDPVAHAVLRVGDQGAIAALLQGGSGAWSLYDGEKVSPLPDPVKTTPYPLDVCFLDDTKPILIVGGKEAGLRLLQPDGSPLPSER